MGGLHLPREAPAVNKKSAGHRIGDRPTASSAANAPNTPLTEAPVFDRPGCLLPASGLFGFTVSPGFVGSVGLLGSVGFVGSVGSDFSLTVTTRLTVYDALSESVTEYISVYSPSFSVFAEPSTRILSVRSPSSSSEAAAPAFGSNASTLMFCFADALSSWYRRTC